VLFKTCRIRNLELRNRFVRSATFDGFADNNGRVTDQQIEFYSALASGGIGLIVTGLSWVHPGGRIAVSQNSIAEDEDVEGLKRLTDSVNKFGAKIALQLSHGGREARFVKTKNELPMAPSLVKKDLYFDGEHRAMSVDEIWEVIYAFGDGARRARDAGFDCVQIHGAHAYLLSQFLSPYTNRRDDEWGGSLVNRLRIHREIYKDIRAKVGKDYPILIKIGVQDGFPEGLKFDEGKESAKYLARVGYDGLEISQGLRGKKYEGTEFRTKINTVDHEAYYRRWTREVKREVDVPLMMVGGLRTFSLMEEIVEKGEADLVSLCRPLIRELSIINSWAGGDRCRSSCISCNKCYEGLFKGMSLGCVFNRT